MRTATAILLACCAPAALTGCARAARTAGRAPEVPNVDTAAAGTPGAAAPRAAPGDTVYVIQHFVRAGRRAQFQRFIEETYWPALAAAARRDSASARVLRQTRVLFPARANGDGTWTFVFVMDPAVRGETYNIFDLLRRVHPAAEASRRYAELTGSWARPFVATALVQPALDAAPGTPE